MNILKKILKFLKLLKYSLWRRGLFNGIAATVELQNIVKETNPETIIDIGSNKGQFVMLIEQLFPNKVIHSFEPLDEPLKKQKKFFSYKKNIFFYNFALGSQTGTREFFVTKRMDCSSFLRVDTKKIENDIFKIDEKKNIQIKTLDEIIMNQNINKPILIKIDVQGFELEVLKGALELLKKVDYLLIEVSDNTIYEEQPLSIEIITFLESKNFKILKQTSKTKNNLSNNFQGDVLFHNKS
jgi:FkbM family methyltransferase